MGVYSVQRYVQGLINGISLPGIAIPLDAYITPPALQDMDGPHAYVSGAKVASGRQTAPRMKYLGSTNTGGYKKAPWAITVYVVYETNADNNPTLDAEFPMILDAIIDVFESARMPQWIDAYGNEIPTNLPIPGATQIDAIGESWSLDYPAEHLPATLRMLWYAAEIIVEVLETRQR
jgi:hypothetical protein